MISTGVITEVLLEKMLVKVDINGRVTNFLPYLTYVSEKVKIFIKPHVGEQVKVVEEGDGLGFVVGSGFSENIEIPTKAEDFDVIVSVMDSSVAIKADGVEIETPLTKIVGDLVVEGNITDNRGDLTNFVTTDGASRA